MQTLSKSLYWRRCTAVKYCNVPSHQRYMQCCTMSNGRWWISQRGWEIRWRTGSSACTNGGCSSAGALAQCKTVIGHGSMLSLSIAKWCNLLNSQSLVYDGDRQAPQDLLNLLPEGTDLDPDTLLMCHELILAFLRRKANVSNIQPNMFP